MPLNKVKRIAPTLRHPLWGGSEVVVSFCVPDACDAYDPTALLMSFGLNFSAAVRFGDACPDGHTPFMATCATALPLANGLSSLPFVEGMAKQIGNLGYAL